MALQKRTQELLEAYTERELGRPRDGIRPEYLSGWQVIEALWPLNDVFRPVWDQVSSVPYQAQYEAAADEAIERYVFSGVAWDERLPAGVWRVLLERHQQAIMVATANEIEGNALMMPIPCGFPESARTGLAMLFWLHQMTLPFEVQDPAAFELPAATHPGSLRKH